MEYASVRGRQCIAILLLTWVHRNGTALVTATHRIARICSTIECLLRHPFVHRTNARHLARSIFAVAIEPVGQEFNIGTVTATLGVSFF